MMRRRPYSLSQPGMRLIGALAIGFAACAAAAAQGDGCRGALSALNRVKETISPSLSAATPAGKERLQVMQSTLENATRNCKDEPELWFYRLMVSERLGDQRDVTFAKDRLDDLDFEGHFRQHFDPFTPPPAALSLASGKIANTPVKKKWALVVGIDHFKDGRINPLGFSAKDSRDMAAYLEDPKGGRFDSSHVTHLENEQATLQGIRVELGRLRGLAGPDDLVLIYFAGHGSPRSVDPNGVSYILAYDTNLDNAATLYATSLQMIDLVQVVNREFKARHVVLMLDTCYSGGALSNESDGTRGLRPSAMEAAKTEDGSFSAAFRTLKLGYGRAVMTASRSDQVSWEDPGIGNGYFTHYLLQALRENGGKADLLHVFPKVQQQVAGQVKAKFGASQNPSFEYSESGDEIVLDAAESN